MSLINTAQQSHLCTAAEIKMSPVVRLVNMLNSNNLMSTGQLCIRPSSCWRAQQLDRSWDILGSLINNVRMIVLAVGEGRRVMKSWAMCDQAELLMATGPRRQVVYLKPCCRHKRGTGRQRETSSFWAFRKTNAIQKSKEHQRSQNQELTRYFWCHL